MKGINKYIGWPDCEQCGGSIEELDIREDEDLAGHYTVRLSLGCYDGVMYNTVPEADLHDLLEDIAGNFFAHEDAVRAITDARSDITLGNWEEEDN